MGLMLFIMFWGMAAFVVGMLVWLIVKWITKKKETFKDEQDIFDGKTDG